MIKLELIFNKPVYLQWVLRPPGHSLNTYFETYQPERSGVNIPRKEII